MNTEQRKNLAAALWAKADELAVFMDDHTERLDFETYAALTENEHILRAVAETLMTPTPERFGRSQLDFAEIALQQSRQVLGLPVQED